MDVFMIIYDPNIESDVLVNRIKALGDSYVFFNNHWLVRSDLTAMDIYYAIASNGYEKSSILVVKIENLQEKGYWGVMNKTIWEWLRK